MAVSNNPNNLPIEVAIQYVMTEASKSGESDVRMHLDRLLGNLKNKEQVREAIKKLTTLKNAIRNGKSDAEVNTAWQSLKAALGAAGYASDSEVMQLVTASPTGSPPTVANRSTDEKEKLSAWLDDIQAILDADMSALGDMTQMDQMQLGQAYTNKNKFEELWSNLNKKEDNSGSKIISNI